MARNGGLRAPIWLPLALAGDPEMKNRVNLKSSVLSVWPLILPYLRGMVCTGFITIMACAAGPGSAAMANDNHPDPVNAYDLSLIHI